MPIGPATSMAMAVISKVPREQRHGAEGSGRAYLVCTQGGLRTPLQPEQEFGERNLLEEPNRLEQHGKDDPRGRRHRDPRRPATGHRHPSLDLVARPEFPLHMPQCDRDTEHRERGTSDQQRELG